VTTTGERVTWVGHATVLLEIGGARLLTDPVLRARLAHLRRHGPRPRPEVAERIDAALISHLHLDHLHLPSLRMLGRDVRVIVPRGAGPVLARRGFSDVVELAVGERVDVAGATVTALRAVHDGRRHPFGGAVAEAIGFAVDGAQRVYFAGDTDIFDAMADLAGRIDVALLPVWGWGPSLGPGHMDPLTAARAAALVRPRLAIPIHWGTLFPIGLEVRHGHVLVEPPERFAHHVRELAPGVEVRVLAPGDALELGTVAT
jgi:L-ascorbate metabolism protein UlaG (beta-lactamase superfamily)